MEDIQLSTFGELLKGFRKQRRITQHELATRVGVHRNSIGSWERGDFLPESKTIVLELAHHLHLDTQQTRRLLEASMTALSPYWHLPYQRNPFFTGRESVLQQLHDTLTHEHTAVLSQSYTLSGLGGIGKTQTAIEYAYRHANDYAAVFWISAETTENIISNMIAIATLLNLPERQEQEQSRVVSAVIRWLTNHRNWLVIFDNVEDAELVKGFWPPARCGSFLLTSRKQALGFTTQTLALEQMTQEEGMHLVLHRARLLDPTAALDSLTPMEEAIAREIVSALGALPLALDQAGAYLEATQCRLSDYLSLFQSSHLRLLDEREAHSDHPLSVTRTFALAFEQLEQSNPAAVEMLTVCAFLAPEAIPEAFFREGAVHLGAPFETFAADPFQFQQALKALLSYSLLQRNPVTQTVTIHRLVQAVLKGRLSNAVQHAWAARVLRAVTHLFPAEEMQADYWQIGGRLLPHALVCLTRSEQRCKDEALCITLMSHIAFYLCKYARYAEAEVLYGRALRLGEDVLGTEHLLVAEALHGLAHLYFEQGKYEDAEPLFQRALHIRVHELGSEHPLVAYSLHGLAEIYWQQGKYEGAESLYQQALHIRVHELGPEHSQVANSLNDLAKLYFEQGKYEDAEPLFQRALHVWEHALGSEHPRIAELLNNLAILHFKQGKYEEAEPLYQQALRIWENTLGPEHPQLAYSLNNQALFSYQRGKYEEAEPLYLRSIRIWEHALGSEHPQLAYPLNNLAYLYYEQGKYEEAKSLFQRVLCIWERPLGSEHPHVAYPLIGLANLSREQGKYEEAESLYQQALRIREQALGLTHPLVAELLNNQASLYYMQGKYEDAEFLYQRALLNSEQALGSEHPNVAYALAGLANLYREQGKYEEAEPWYQRALRIREQALGPEHVEVAELLTGLAQLYAEQGKYKQAEPLYQRALAVRQHYLGPEHPAVAETLHPLARFHQLQRQNREALSLYQQALFIREQKLGTHHPKTCATRSAYIHLVQEMRQAEDATVLGELVPEEERAL